MSLNPPDAPKSVFAFPNIYTKKLKPLRKMNSNEIITHTPWPPAFPIPSSYLPTFRWPLQRNQNKEQKNTSLSQWFQMISGFLGLGLAREDASHQNGNTATAPFPPHGGWPWRRWKIQCCQTAHPIPCSLARPGRGKNTIGDEVIFFNVPKNFWSSSGNFFYCGKFILITVCHLATWLKKWTLSSSPFFQLAATNSKKNTNDRVISLLSRTRFSNSRNLESDAPKCIHPRNLT